jgi:hypothetical protein
MKLRLLVIAVVLAAASGLASPISATARPGHEASSSATPPASAGSFLALVNHGPVDDFGVQPTSQTLELVSPAGARTTIYTRAVPYPDKIMYLEDWSVDGSTALLSVSKRHGESLYRVDVASGTVTRIPASLVAGAILDPAGTGLIAERFLLNDTHGRLGLMRIAWDGTLTPSHAFVDGSILAGPHGTVVTGGDRPGAHALRVISLRTGHVQRSLSTSAYCQPVRQWDPRRSLVRCGRSIDLFTLGSGSLSELAGPYRSGDQSNVDAQRLGGTTYVETAGVCDIDSIARWSQGRLHRVRVPGAHGGLSLVTTAQRKLVLWHTGPCYSRLAEAAAPDELSLFDPAAGTDSPLVTLGAEEDFERVLTLGDVRALHP